MFKIIREHRKPDNNLESLIENYQRLVSYVINCYLALEDDRQEAAERVWHDVSLMQEPFSRLDEKQQKNLICQIARNKAVDVYRERAKNDNVPLDETIDQDVRTNLANAGQGVAERIALALQSLNEEDYKLLSLLYEYGYTIGELSKYYKCKEKTLYKRVERAKNRLAQLLAEDGIDVKQGF